MVFALRGPSASRQEFARRNLGSALTQVDTDELAVYGSRTKPGACLGCVVAGDLHQPDLEVVRSPALRSADPTARDGRVGYDEGEGATSPHSTPVN